jgi:precorrin-4/cobalt-precorrin-4 C11-methyltransferase
MKNGVVVFAGAGPGAPDLITLRGRKAVEEADLIIYAGSLVKPEILSAAKPGCEIHDSSKMDLGEMVERMAKGAKDGLKVLRLHTGDPSIYGAIGEQMRELDKLGVPYEVVPGVSSVFASAAALRAELTIPGISQTVILTRLAGRTPVPEGQDIRGLAAHKATMAIFLSILDIAPLAKELVAGGYPESTAVAIVHRASWSDERILRGTLADIAAKAAAAKLGRQAMIIVGDSLRNEGERSKLYDAAFTHGWREATRTPAVETPSAESRDGGEGSVPPSAIAVYAITENGARTAAKIGAAFRRRSSSSSRSSPPARRSLSRKESFQLYCRAIGGAARRTSS